MDADALQDREAEPRFIGSTGGRGGFGGGMQGGYGGGGGGYGGGFGAGGPGRQIYIANVCNPCANITYRERVLIVSSFPSTSAGKT